MILVIGLAGRIAAGKGAAAKYLKKKYKAEQFVYSDILCGILERLHIEPTRENLQKLGKGLRESLGEKVLVNAMRGNLAESKAELRLIDGIRYVNEVDMLHSFPHNRLIFIDSPLELRYERAKKRAEKGEASLTLIEFKEKEKAATEMELDKVKAMADCVIDNTGSIKDLHAKIDPLLGQQ